jgi:hypothetical protein
MNPSTCHTVAESTADYSCFLPASSIVRQTAPIPEPKVPNRIRTDRTHGVHWSWDFLDVVHGSSSSASDDVDVVVGLERAEDPLILEIDEFRILDEGWDGEVAAKPNATAIDQAIRFVRAAGNLSRRLEPGLHVDGSVILEIGNGIEGSIRFMGDDRIIYSAIGIAPSVSRFDGRSVPEVIKIVLGS